MQSKRRQKLRPEKLKEEPLERSEYGWEDNIKMHLCVTMQARITCLRIVTTIGPLLTWK